MRSWFLLLVRLFYLSAISCQLISCSSSKTTSAKFFRDTIPIVSFCDLPQFKGKQVYLRCYYSGIEEYWSLKDIEKKNCSPKLRIDLQFAGKNPFLVPKKFEKAFSDVRDNYYNSFLLIEAIGMFENDNKSGYGHLGSNNARFIISELVKAEVIRK